MLTGSRDFSSIPPEQDGLLQIVSYFRQGRGSFIILMREVWLPAHGYRYPLEFNMTDQMSARRPAVVNSPRGPRSALPDLGGDGRWATGFLTNRAFLSIRGEAQAVDLVFQDQEAFMSFCSLPGKVSERKLPTGTRKLPGHSRCEAGDLWTEG